ncbi:adenylosuccinate synthetase [Nanoarchaeota archaeon]
MAKVAILGLQVGDEGKGKFVEYLTSLAQRSVPKDHFLNRIHNIDRLPKDIQRQMKKHILTYRWQGGANAGHTIPYKDGSVIAHLLPSSIVNPNAFCFMGAGMLIHMRKAVKEILELRDLGVHVGPDNLGISSEAHVTLDFHTNEDKKNFDLSEHTTTGNGISQTASAKFAYKGIRFCEFLDKKAFIRALTHIRVPSPEAVVQSYEKEREFLKSFLCEEWRVFRDPRFVHWIGEGAQGACLDIDYGMYPGVTASSPTRPTHRPETLIGVTKLYTSSVGIGNRAFVEEMPEKVQDAVRKQWQEFGATTGKPRHIGYYNVLHVKRMIALTHVDHIVGSCLDRLEDLGKLGLPLKICIGYELEGKEYFEWDAEFDKRFILKEAKPIFEVLPSWTKTVDDNGQLHPNAKNYINRLEHHLGMKFSLIGIGPRNKDIVIKEDLSPLFR